MKVAGFVLSVALLLSIVSAYSFHFTERPVQLNFNSNAVFAPRSFALQSLELLNFDDVLFVSCTSRINRQCISPNTYHGTVSFELEGSRGALGTLVFRNSQTGHVHEIILNQGIGNGVNNVQFLVRSTTRSFPFDTWKIRVCNLGGSCVESNEGQVREIARN